jgi:GntR family transcriptional regulator
MDQARALGATKVRGNHQSLSRSLADGLRARVMSGEFPPGSRLPSEASISEEYGLSRVTVRTAITLLESQGLVSVRHGTGTFVSDFGNGVIAGLQELRSLSDTIRDMGLTPGVKRRDVRRRPATEIEARQLGLTPSASVIAAERAIYADEELVAFTYETITDHDYPDAFVTKFGSTSMSQDMEDVGLLPIKALAELHAVCAPEIGWGDERPANNLYLQLQQTNFNKDGLPVMFNTTYFVEGRFRFVILRTR